MDDPKYDAIIERANVEAVAANRDDAFGQWAAEMIGSREGEEEVFLRGAKTFFRNVQTSRRAGIYYLATLFRADRDELKRYLRFKGVVNLKD